MACLSPSPSGRRLSELLEEQQEPFSLDLHLLEKGCSSARLLDGYDTALCWPAPATDAAAVLKRLTSNGNRASSSHSRSHSGKKQPAGGLLKLILSKIIHGKAAGSQKKPAALQFSDSFKVAPCAVKAAAAGECSHSDSDSESSSYSDDDEKQCSPVSVLEPHPFESSPIHGKASPGHGRLSPSRNAAMDILRELTQLLAKSDDLVPSKDPADAAENEEEDDEDCYYGGYRTSPRNGSRYGDEAYWEAHKAELARVSELVAAEVPRARLDAAALQPEREDVGAGLADDLLDALVQDLVADLGC